MSSARPSTTSALSWKVKTQLYRLSNFQDIQESCMSSAGLDDYLQENRRGNRLLRQRLASSIGWAPTAKRFPIGSMPLR
jgi:hypothetical protein